MMIEAETLQTLAEWLKRMIAFRRQVRALSTITGESWVDASPFGRAVSDLSCHYTDTVSQLVNAPYIGEGINQKSLLQWHATDNQLGERGLMAQAPGWEEPITIRTVEDLAAFIAASNQFNQLSDGALINEGTIMGNSDKTTASV